MRIIAGSAKGRTLASPDGATRPTSDRAREGIFSTVESLIDFEPDLHVLDLFAGTGAWGIEAASRGAGHVDLVERESRAVAVCQENISRVGLPVKVHLASVEKWLTQAIVKRDANAEVAGDPLQVMLIHIKSIVNESISLMSEPTGFVA